MASIQIPIPHTATTVEAALLKLDDRGYSHTVLPKIMCAVGEEHAKVLREVIQQTSLRPLTPGYYFLHELTVGGQAAGQFLTVVEEDGDLIVKEGIVAPTPRLTAWPPRKP